MIFSERVAINASVEGFLHSVVLGFQGFVFLIGELRGSETLKRM